MSVYIKIFDKLKLYPILFILCSSNVYASVDDNHVCKRTISNIESLTDIPKNLLLGIGKTEAGRVYKGKELIVWPWTVNHSGKSLFFDDQKQMKKYVLKHVLKGDNNLDVGCMQINLKWHKHNFKKINDMISPEPNISYAASFLLQLKKKYGSWKEAIKYYHSSDPIKNKPYLEKVLNFWERENSQPTNVAVKIKNKTNKKTKVVSELDSLKERQPFLSARWERVAFFRKIFLEK